MIMAIHNIIILSQTQKQSNSNMGFKATIDISLSFSILKICSIRQQGFIKFRVLLYHLNEYGDKKIETITCHPYSIIKSKNQSKINHPPNYQNRTSKLIELQSSELDSQFFLSRGFKVMFDKQSHPIMTYVDVQKYPELNLKCEVQLLFCPTSVLQNSADYKTIGRCSCKIRKLFDISTYFPIIFDEFQGVAIEGVYNAALMDFHFAKETEEETMELGHSPDYKFTNFYDYLSNVSGGFNRQQTRKFYQYYRNLLEKELFAIQQRHYDLLRNLNQSNEDFRMIKLNQNEKINQMISQLSGYNSNNSDRMLYKGKFSKNASNQSSKYYYRSPSKRNFSQYSSFQFSDNTYSDVSSNSANTYPENPKQMLQSHRKKLSEQIMHDYLSVKGLIFQKWSQFVDFTNQNVAPIAQKYKSAYDKIVKERLAVNVFSHSVQTNDWKKSAYEDLAKDHLKQSDAQKKKIEKDEELWKEVFLIENQHFFQKASKCIKIFEQIYPVHVNNINSSKRFSLRQIELVGSNNHQKLFTNKSIQQPTTQPLYPPHKSFQLNKHSASIEPRNSFFDRKASFQMQKLKPIQYSEESKQVPKKQKQDHFVVLVHGYQASRQDLMVFKNCLEIRFSQIKVFISTCNEGRTEDSIEVLGRRFALELQKFINNSSPSYNYKLSFIGHSMGGLIVRTALCYLQNINRNLYTYISLSTPHIGYLYEASTHIHAGLWVMKTLQKSNSIEQICMRDSEELRDTFLYKLSKSGSLNKFKNLAFVSSAQDKYIAFESARVEQNQAIIADKMSISSGQIIYQMIEGILGNIESPNISRIDVVFNIEQSNFDTMIGRTAHIKYLSDRQFIKTFCIVFDKFFR